MKEQNWKEKLTNEQHHILREKGTERAFSGKYWDNHKKGTYLCAGCQAKLFTSDSKFDSGTGWPSFSEAANKKNITEKPDNGFLSRRTEVICSKCGGRLGHVFSDGPKPTGQRYCINSGALTFKEKR